MIVFAMLAHKLAQTVTAVDPKAKIVTLDNKEKLSYSSLVLSPGAIPRKLPIEGVNLGNVFTLRHAEDAKVIEAGELDLW